MILTFMIKPQSLVFHKLAKNQYICVATYNISSPSDISSSLLFLENLRADP